MTCRCGCIRVLVDELRSQIGGRWKQLAANSASGRRICRHRCGIRADRSPLSCRARQKSYRIVYTNRLYSSNRNHRTYCTSYNYPILCDLNVQAVLVASMHYLNPKPMTQWMAAEQGVAAPRHFRIG